MSEPLPKAGPQKDMGQKKKKGKSDSCHFRNILLIWGVFGIVVVFVLSFPWK